MSIHSFARPYEAESLDRLQALAYGCQFVYLFLGILMSTERGSTDLAQTLEISFVVIFFLSLLVSILYVARDLRRFFGKKKIAQLNSEFDLNLQPAIWSFTNLFQFLSNKPSEEQLQMLRELSANMTKYPQPAWMKPRILVLAKNAPELFDYCCDPNYAGVDGTLGHQLQYYLTQGAEEEFESQLKELDKDTDQSSEQSGIQVVCHALKNAILGCFKCCFKWTVEDDQVPKADIPDDESLLQFWFKVNHHTTPHFYNTIHCHTQPCHTFTTTRSHCLPQHSLPHAAIVCNTAHCHTLQSLTKWAAGECMGRYAPLRDCMHRGRAATGSSNPQSNEKVCFFGVAGR